MHRGPIQYPVLQLAVRASQRVRGALADRIHRAGAQLDTEQIAEQLADTAAGDPMPGGQGHDRRLQSGPKRRAGKLDRQPCAGPCPAVPAAQLMRSMLHRDHADRRQFADLVATEPPARPALPLIEPAPATAARLRVVIDDLIDPILGLEIATRTPVPGLPIRIATLALPPQKLLGLRAGLRAPLRASGAVRSTAAWNWCVNPGASAPPDASADPRAA